MMGGSLLLGAAGCTDKFEDFNTNPKAPTMGEMEGDFAYTATLIGNMIPVVAIGQENDFQMIRPHDLGKQHVGHRRYVRHI